MDAGTDADTEQSLRDLAIWAGADSSLNDAYEELLLEVASAAGAFDQERYH
jgi:hypothetical protein